MNIKERIKKINEFFREMQIVNVDGEQIIYVVVSFPKGWTISDQLEEKYNITIERGQKQGEYYFSADIETGEEQIFDAIDENISRMKEIIERAQLLRDKTLELKDLFEDETITIEQLRKLTFTFNELSQLEHVLPSKSNTVSTPKNIEDTSTAQDFNDVEKNNKKMTKA